MTEAAHDQKACPYCGEQILAVAIKCKHCGSMLKGAVPGAAPLAAAGVERRNWIAAIPRGLRTILAFWLPVLVFWMILSRWIPSPFAADEQILAYIFLFGPMVSLATGLVPGFLFNNFLAGAQKSGVVATWTLYLTTLAGGIGVSYFALKVIMEGMTSSRLGVLRIGPALLVLSGAVASYVLAMRLAVKARSME